MTNAFKKGMGDAPKRHQVLIREEIKRALGITSRVQFNARRDGKVDFALTSLSSWLPLALSL